MIMMRKIVLIPFLVAVLLLTSLCGQEKAGKSFLWKIESDTGASYLLGSVHFLKKETYPLREVIEDAFEQCDVLVVEADVSNAKMAEVSMMTLQKGMYQGEETLKDNLSEKTYQLAKKKMDELGLNIEGFAKFKPWMAAINILGMQLMKMGFNPNYGIDKYFLEKATGKKEILELEGIEFQLNLFDSFLEEESEKFLLSTILEADQIGKEVDNLVNAWVSGDTVKMEQILTENIRKYPKLENLYKRLIDDRNERMVEKIITYLNSGEKYFIVAGAAHMIGKKGIVPLLKAKGYTVKQL